MVTIRTTIGDFISPYYSEKYQKNLQKLSKLIKKDLIKKRESLGFDIGGCRVRVLLDIRVEGLEKIINLK